MENRSRKEKKKLFTNYLKHYEDLDTEKAIDIELRKRWEKMMAANERFNEEFED